jgi:hypothetical protein
MSKRLLITEDEKKQIKNLYNINEIDAEKLVSSLFSKAMEIAKNAEKDKTTSDETETSDNYDDTIPSSSVGSSSDFLDITKKVIKKFEGGYFTHDCPNHPKNSIYDNSGETMFGLDRKAGDIENISSKGKEFFGLIDQDKKKLGMDAFCKKWKYNYKGGELEERLLTLAAEIMSGLYEKNAQRYFKGKTKSIVETSKPLMLHFSYATWNGPGFFKYFAESMNKAVEDGKSIRELVKIAKEDRNEKFGGTAWATANKKVLDAIDDEAGFVA